MKYIVPYLNTSHPASIALAMLILDSLTSMSPNFKVEEKKTADGHPNGSFKIPFPVHKNG
ncbi:unnamed protein product [Orchesella dallaii]|uniref:Uncharacterized protein n=1 Tax=Orchesella dallaii TaxID=48710 RepID=A0ABP1PVJ9_9HEXA